MAVLSKGTDFSTGQQVTAALLDALVDSATFVSGAVDGSTTQLSSGAIIVKDGGITTAKIAAGAEFPGTTTNNSATAGYVGEFTSSTVETASAISLTDLTAANVTSISLTAGDWDVDGQIEFREIGTGAYFISGSINTVSATTGSFPALQYTMSDALSIRQAGMAVPTVRVSIASTTTVYLVARAGFGSTCKAAGIIRARRVR